MRPLRALVPIVSLAAPWVALASAPPGPNSSVPTCFSLVGSVAGVPADAQGAFTVVVRDIANNPISGIGVTIDLSNAPDLTICADQLDPAATVTCGNKTVRKVTIAGGLAQFTLLGGSNGAGNAMTLIGAGRIFAEGFLLGSPSVSAYDLDGSGGVGANDLSAWFGDFGSGQGFGRSDYDCSNTIGANDLSLWLRAFGSGAMAQSCGMSCP